jgi:ketosteroid isomerase-like protein
MSEENVEVVLALVDAYHRGDLDEFISYADPEGELHSAVIGGAEGRVYKGHQGLRDWYADTFETFEEVRVEVSELRDLGDLVVVLGQMKARGRESGVSLDSPTGWIWAFRGGKVIRAEGFLSHTAALEAAGLQE